MNIEIDLDIDEITASVERNLDIDEIAERALENMDLTELATRLAEELGGDALDTIVSAVKYQIDCDNQKTTEQAVGETVRVADAPLGVPVRFPNAATIWMIGKLQGELYYICVDPAGSNRTRGSMHKVLMPNSSRVEVL